jgi:hypothetical protein
MTKPRLMRSPCYNAGDGCTCLVSYMAVKPLRKLCSVCLESGPPSERPQAGFNFSKMMRNVKSESIRGIDLCGAICCEVTVWPKTLTDGRVSPCPREG